MLGGKRGTVWVRLAEHAAFASRLTGSVYFTADMSKPVYRHLVEQRWREEGDLDLLVRSPRFIEILHAEYRREDGTYPPNERCT